MSILVISDSKALLRYHVNALGEDAGLPLIDKSVSSKERVTNRTKNASKASQKNDKSKDNDSKDFKPKSTENIKE